MAGKDSQQAMAFRQPWRGMKQTGQRGAFGAQYEGSEGELTRLLRGRVTSDSFGAQSEAPRIECLREGFGAQYEAAHSRLVTSDSFGAQSEAPRIECLREGFGLSGSDGNEASRSGNDGNGGQFTLKTEDE